MKTWLMKPYSHRQSSKEMRIFNYSLSRCRNPVENTFGIISQRFRCLLGTMHLRPENANMKCVLACCCLHNLLAEGKPKTIYRGVDIEDPVYHNVVEGDWHQEEQALLPMTKLGRNIAANQISKDQRNFLMDYYNGV